MGLSCTRTVKFLKKGDRGASLRGPQAWSDCAVGYPFQAGGTGETYLDVVLYNDYYYVCKVSHSKTANNYPGSTISEAQGLWQLGESIDLVATKILLAEYALIKNLGVETIDMRDANNNILFQAKDGAVTCKTGTFEGVTIGGGTIGGFKINNDYIGNDSSLLLETPGTSLRKGKLELYSYLLAVSNAYNKKIKLDATTRYSTLVDLYDDSGASPMVRLENDASNGLAISVVAGMFAGFRPFIGSQNTGTLTDYQNIVIADHSTASTIYLPSSPKKGQMYIIYHTTSTGLTVSGNGKSIKRLMASGLTTVTSITSTTVETILCNWDGSYWYLTYIKV